MPKINELPAASSFGAADLLATDNRSGTATKKVSGQQIKDYVTADVAADVTDLKNAIVPYNAVNALALSSPTSRTNFNVTFDFNADKSCYVHGKSTNNGASGQYFASSTSIPGWLTLGATYTIKYSSTNVWFQIWDYSGGTLTKLLETKTDTTFTVPSNVTGLLIRLSVSNGVTANETVRPMMISAQSNQELEEICKKVMYPKIAPLTNGSYVLSNISAPGMYIPDVSYATTDAPADFSQRVYFLEVECFNYRGVANRFTKQTVYGVGSGITGKIYYRMSNYSGTYGAWVEFGGGENVTNNYTFNEYSQTLTVNASPYITTDTNSYLAPTGDTTDRTADILAMLNSTGVCRLGKGNYYVKNLIMPENTSIIGCGRGTSVRLSTGSGAEYAIKVNSSCVVENLTLYGLASSFTPNASIRNRTGILWQGTYTADQTAPYRAIVRNLWIYNFEGSGIKCYDTGYRGDCSICVDNVFIWSCDAGINIAYWSEFNKFINVRSSSCYYGCVNNGGNNMFANCDFSSNKLCFLMDNSSSQSPNNSHGSCVGCIFNHADSNNGVGIKVLNCDNGFVFDGCQSFYAQIDIEDSDGVTVSNSNFGSSNGTITIKNGGAVLFVNNMYGAAPTISVTNNNKVHFANCYVRSTGAAVSA